MYLQEQPSIAWDAIQYMTGEIYYGGRVTDEWDRRLLKSVLRRFYTPQILDDSYKISPSGTYRSPPEGSLQSFRQYIDQLPLTDEPEAFGLHENANITYQTRETHQLINNLLSIQPRVVLAEGTGNDDVGQEIAKR
jgi:dynein heavy chain